uniref:ABC-2 type transporter transmembrane domain-containing protein n=1 Tax=Acrobeloides nanus TaxID=290746 RepID=A0A914D8B6_9BILA
MTTIIYIVRTIVMEKEARLKEYMKVMGLSQWVQWLSHFILNYTKILAVVGVLFGLTYIMIPHTNPALLIILYALFAFNVVYFAFMISTILHSGTGGTLLAVVGWITLYIWENVFMSFDNIKVFSTSVRLLSSLNPLVALALGLKLIGQFEAQADGLHWNTLFHPPSPDRTITMAHTFMMLIIDGLIYVLLTWYIEAVNPGGEGVPQKPWFFVQRSYWFPRSKHEESGSNDDEIEHGYIFDKSKIEKEPNMTPTVRIINLCKTYTTSWVKKISDCRFVIFKLFYTLTRKS